MEEKIEPDKVLETLMVFFETGSAETDAVAKTVFESDPEYAEYWLEKITLFQKSIDWTGIRSPEAEILAAGLRQLQDKVSHLD